MDGRTEVIGVEWFNKVGLQIKAQRERVDEIKSMLSEEQSTLRDLEHQFLTALGENGMRKYCIPDYGTAYITKRLSYKVPKTLEEREAFFGHLKEKGLFEDMITVHSQTLNSWAKRELEVAAEMGADDFQIPGLGDPTYSESLGVKKS